METFLWIVLIVLTVTILVLVVGHTNGTFDGSRPVRKGSTGFGHYFNRAIFRTGWR